MAAKKKQKETPKISLHEIGEGGVSRNFVLLDFGDVFEHEEYGRSVPLELQTKDGKSFTMWLNEKTRAGKTFFTAMENGDVETPCKVNFRPRSFTSDKDGKDYTSVRMFIGKQVATDDGAEVPF